MAAETVELHKLKVPVEPLRPRASPGRDRPRQRGGPGLPPAAPDPGTVPGGPCGARVRLHLPREPPPRRGRPACAGRAAFLRARRVNRVARGKTRQPGAFSRLRGS